ncbi:hypothetical protein HPP92_024156 [Vanilla planifolia]|uniref:Uncharacterized protein n=1 Tax=Vanilla planifolia TaxID=51239 RepID=A0A835PKC7_VANPL|nr:hypothetical protein HPP92_024156 [Vanilla planifolia]
MARDCPKVSDMKAANTPTSGGRGSANHGRGRGFMATSGSAAHGGAAGREESARAVELELGILETSRGREKGSFSGIYIRTHRRRGGPSFSRGGALVMPD